MLICLIFFSPLFLWYVPLFSFTSSTLLIYALFHLCCSIIERVPLNSSKREERAGRVLGIVIVTIKTTITIMDCCYVVIVVTNCCHSYHDGWPGSRKPHFVCWAGRCSAGRPLSAPTTLGFKIGWNEISVTLKSGGSNIRLNFSLILIRIVKMIKYWWSCRWRPCGRQGGFVSELLQGDSESSLTLHIN